MTLYIRLHTEDHSDTITEYFESWAEALTALRDVYGRPSVHGTYTLATEYHDRDPRV